MAAKAGMAVAVAGMEGAGDAADDGMGKGMSDD
jgi:hypothetical protein